MKSENKKTKGNNCHCENCDCETQEQKINELALIIDKVEDEKLEIQNQLKKALADYHNLLNNSVKRENLKLFQSKKKLFEEILPSLDAMMMAVEGSKNISLDESGKAWLEGLVATISSILKSLGNMGLVQYVPSKGDLFNTEVHEAVAAVEGAEKGKIVDTLQPGYILENTVIRPARVVVSK